MGDIHRHVAGVHARDNFSPEIGQAVHSILACRGGKVVVIIPDEGCHANAHLMIMIHHVRIVAKDFAPLDAQHEVHVPCSCIGQVAYLARAPLFEGFKGAQFALNDPFILALHALPTHKKRHHLHADVVAFKMDGLHIELIIGYALHLHAIEGVSVGITKKHQVSSMRILLGVRS